MEWQQILGFYYVAKTGSFTRAAEATYRTQSALSQQVKALEVELGCTLLERIGRRRLRLTLAGEKFFLFARDLVLRRQELLDELNELKGRQQGRLRIAAPFTSLAFLLPDIIERYIRTFPQVKLTVLERPPLEIVDLVKGGDIDLGLVMESMVPKDLAVSRWRKAESVILAPRGHPLLKTDWIGLGDIARYPLILPPRGLKYSARANLEDRLEAEGLSYRIVMESSNVFLSALYVEMGLGIASATVIHEGDLFRNRDIDLIGLDRLIEPDHLSLVMRADKKWPPYKRAFLDLLQE